MSWLCYGKKGREDDSRLCINRWPVEGRVYRALCDLNVCTSDYISGSNPFLTKYKTDESSNG